MSYLDESNYFGLDDTANFILYRTVDEPDAADYEMRYSVPENCESEPELLRRLTDDALRRAKAFYIKLNGQDNPATVKNTAAIDKLLQELEIRNTAIPSDNKCRIISIAVGANHTVGLKADGTVVATGYNEYGQCNVSDWQDITAIAAGFDITVGLKADGTVVAAGKIEGNAKNCRRWRNIAAIAACWNTIFGLRKNGTIISTGITYDGTAGWKGITALGGGCFGITGLKNDGTVVATEKSGLYNCEEMIAIADGTYHRIAQQKDGTLRAYGKNDKGQGFVKYWQDIVAIAAGHSHTVGLKADGTVVATGDDEWGQCNVFSWKDIVAIGAGSEHTVGLRYDGTVVAVGHNKYGQCNVQDWGK